MDLAGVKRFFKSYEEAVCASDARAMVSHYSEPFMAFSLGRVVTMPNHKEAVESSQPYLDLLKRTGLARCIVVDISTTSVSDHFTLCYPVFQMTPEDGKPAWQFRNVYGMRHDEKGPRLEFAVSDNEMTNLLQRYPALFQSL